MEPSPDAAVPWSDEDLSVRVLRGQPPAGFDCGREAQNAFLYRRAWRDLKAGVSVTHLLFVKGIFAGYVTLLMDKIGLGAEETLRSVYWRSVPAVKIAQLAVDKRFAGQGLGAYLISYTVAMARDLRRGVGCRLLSLDASPDLVPWYQSRGFQPNSQEQRVRADRARTENRDLTGLPISMRFDLLEVRR